MKNPPLRQSEPHQNGAVAVVALRDKECFRRLCSYVRAEDNGFLSIFPDNGRTSRTAVCDRKEVCSPENVLTLPWSLRSWPDGSGFVSSLRELYFSMPHHSERCGKHLYRRIRTIPQRLFKTPNIIGLCLTRSRKRLVYSDMFDMSSPYIRFGSCIPERGAVMSRPPRAH